MKAWASRKVHGSLWFTTTTPKQIIKSIQRDPLRAFPTQPHKTTQIWEFKPKAPDLSSPTIPLYNAKWQVLTVPLLCQSVSVALSSSMNSQTWKIQRLHRIHCVLFLFLTDSRDESHGFTMIIHLTLELSCVVLLHWPNRATNSGTNLNTSLRRGSHSAGNLWSSNWLFW